MRQRSLTQRIFTAFFGIWFSLLVAEPVPMDVCPMHDTPPAPAAAHHAMMLHDGASAPSGHVAMRHALQSHDEPATDTPGGHGAHQCQCLGCCAGTSAVTMPSAPVFNVQATLTSTQVRRIDARESLQTATRFAYALPFANGPPRARSLLQS